MRMIDVENIHERDIEEISSFIFSEMKSQVGKLDFDEMITRLKRFNKSIDSPLGMFTEESEGGMEIVTLYGHHTLGTAWNKIQSEVYAILFEKLGLRVLEKSSDEMSYTVIIKKPRKS